MSVRILLVEDERAIGDFVVRGLREEGFTVEWATDGESGWQHLRCAWDCLHGRFRNCTSVTAGCGR